MSTSSKQQSPAPQQIVDQALQALEIQLEHDAECHAETQYWLQHPGLDDPSLVDLGHLPFITMDNPDSRDLDQAFLVERHGESVFRLRYALADAAYYVRPGSALFAAALARGTTYYTPLLAAPMLPVELSEGLISLNPQQLRRALVFDMLVERDGTVLRCNIERARIFSRAKLDYAGVQRWLDADLPAEQEWHESLLLLRELGEHLIQATARRGVIRFDRSETRIELHQSPARFVPGKRQRHETERYNEQLSLLCNMQGAEMLLALSGVSDTVQAVFRVHEAPLRRRLKDLRETLDAFAEQQAEPERWRWQDGQSLAAYVDALPDDASESRRVQAVQRQIMQSQRASNFEPEAGEHHALKAASYARFSSPMREVVGIFTHKELLEALGGHAFDNDHDDKLRQQVIDSANLARQKQRKLDKTIEFATLSSVFSQELASARPTVHEGTLMGLRSDRLYVALDDMALDVKLYRRDLEAQFDTTYTLGAASAVPADENRPTWQLGDALRLQVRDFDSERQRYRFDIEAVDRAART